jgi:hypothetical protein
MVFSEELGSCIPAWKNPSRRMGVNGVYYKLGKGKYKEAGWAQVESADRESMLFFFRCF